MKKYIAIFLILLLLCSCAPKTQAPEETETIKQESVKSETIPEPEPEPEPEPDPDPDPDPDPVGDIMTGMTLEEKVGQLFFAHYPGDIAPGEAEKYGLGGYIFFAKDFENLTAEQVKENINAVQSGVSIPMFTGVDEEGGTVVRVSSNPNLRSEKFKSPQSVYAAGGWEGIVSDTREKAQLLLSLGININFAPVCDVSTDQNDFIYRRSFGADAGTTAQYVKTVVETMEQEKIGSVLKHFPGYGSNTDTHIAAAVDDRPYESFQQSDFLPFTAGVQAGGSMVMVSHNTVTCMDPDMPASLSYKVNEILRRELEFDGVVITDDLTMGAVTDVTDSVCAAVTAIKAGSDMVCCYDYAVQIPAVTESVEAGEIPIERIDEAVRRVLTLKVELGILEVENEDS